MDQEDTDKMDFIEDVVHEPFYLIPISFPILFRSYAKDKVRTFGHQMVIQSVGQQWIYEIYHIIPPLR